MLFSQSGIGSVYDIPAIWRGRASKLTITALDCGHFIAEERPAEVAHALQAFLGT